MTDWLSGYGIRILIHKWLVLRVRFLLKATLVFADFETPLMSTLYKNAKSVRFVLFRETQKVCLYFPTRACHHHSHHQNLTMCQCLIGRTGSRHILPSRLPVTIDTMLNFDGDCDGDGHRIRTRKHTIS